MRKLVVLTAAMKVVVLVTAMWSSPAMAIGIGIPTFDSAQALNFIRTLQHYKDQWDQLEREYEKLRATHDALTGVRNLGEVFDDPLLRRYLPREWLKVYREMKKLGYDGLVREGAAMWAINKVFERCDKITLLDERLDCETRAALPSQNQADISMVMEKIASRGDQIRELQAAINATEDPKAIAELQARIAIEQVAVQNEASSIMAMNMAMENERQVLSQRALEFNSRARSAKGGAMLSPLTFGEE